MMTKKNERISNAQMAAELRRLPKQIFRAAKDRAVLSAKKAYIILTTLIRDTAARIAH
ncbi:hypothetical protein EROP_29890 [Erysipelotrichaceae bacterium OPF54]|nr:hypothetical protein EROP_29890 [Erysipelotrichaceae bacterium OPF54]